MRKSRPQLLFVCKWLCLANTIKYTNLKKWLGWACALSNWFYSVHCAHAAEGGSQVHRGLPTVWVVASMKGPIKEINVMWQPRDIYTYYWTVETSTVSERDAMWRIPGKSLNPSNSIIGYPVFPVVFFSFSLSARISSSETMLSLPALTLAACRSRNKMMIAVKVESIIHLFVFHLKDHLCISMTAAPTSESNFWATSGDFKALPQSRVMMEPFLEKSHKWGVFKPRLSAAQRPPILRPSAQPSRWR